MSAQPRAEVRLERRYRFSSSHLYRRSAWTEEENRSRFGKCANLPGHGHNYRLYVTVTGPVDPETGFLVDLEALDRAVDEAVIAKLDHQHLNLVIEDFRERLIPSGENLIVWIRDQLRDCLPPSAEMIGLRLEEDEDLATELVLPR